MRKLIAPVIVLLMLLAACSGASEGQSDVDDTGTASPPPSPSETSVEPTVMTKKQAGIYYLTSVCPVNVELYAWGDKYGGKAEYEVNLQEAKVDSRKLAQSFRESAGALQDPPLKWPKGVTKDALAVSKQNLAEVTYYNTLGRAHDWADFVDASNAEIKGDNRAAEQVRLTLDLPAAGKCPDWAERAKRPTMAKP